MPVVTGKAKVYTEEEIKAFDLATAEKFAKNLEWRSEQKYNYDYGGSRRGRYEEVGSKQYKKAGFPNKYAGQKCTDRRDYLIKRLLKSEQKTWNAQMQDALAAIEAAKPKVKIKTKITIELKDHRKNGQVFDIERKGDKVVAAQRQENNYGRAGARVCATQGRFSAQDFEDAIDLISNAEIPSAASQTKGRAKLVMTASVVLTGSHTLYFFRQNGIIGISQTNNGRNLSTLHSDDWQFRTSDLQEVIKALKTRYIPVADTEKKEAEEPAS